MYIKSFGFPLLATQYGLSGSVFFFFPPSKTREVGGIKETISVLTVPNASLWGGQAERCLTELLGFSQGGNSPKTRVVHDLHWTRSSYSRAMSGLFGRTVQLL